MGETPNKKGEIMTASNEPMPPIIEYQEEDQNIQYSACDAELFIFKDLQQHMSHPFFSLSKRPSFRTIKYENGDDWIKIKPSATGRATIYDKDILVYIISQIIQKEKNKEPISRHVSINPIELLKSINRGVGGKDYKSLCDALDRLEGTRIQTNIAHGGLVETSAYGMLDSYTAARKDNKADGRMISLKVSLSAQLFNSIKTKKELLTVNPEYFNLGKPIEKKIYEIARKHVGRKTQQAISTEVLLKKSGSLGNIREMRRSIKSLVKTHQKDRSFPDYTVHYNADKDQVVFTQKEKWWENQELSPDFKFPKFATTTYETARTLAPSFDIYFLESEFEKWVMSKPSEFKLDKKNLTKTFLAFCKTKEHRKVCSDNGQEDMPFQF